MDIEFLIIISAKLILILNLTIPFFNYKEYLSTLTKYDYYYILSVFSVSLFCHIYFAIPAHMIFTDESVYVITAQEINQENSLMNFSKSIGWPVTLSFLFHFVDINVSNVFKFNLLIGSITFIPIYITLKKQIKSDLASRLSCLMIAISPLALAWAASAKNNTFSIFFISLSMLNLVILLKQKKLFSLFLLTLSISMSALIRPENYILFLVPTYLIFKEDLIHSSFRSKVLVYFTSISFCIPNLINVLSFQTSLNWLSQNNKFLSNNGNWSLHNLTYNLENYLPVLFSNDYIPTVVLIMLLPGIFFLYKEQKRFTLVLISILVLYLSIYFTSYFQAFGGKLRFFILPYIIFYIISSYTVGFTSNSLKTPRSRCIFTIAALIVYVLSFVPYLNDISSYNFKHNILQSRIPSLIESEFGNKCIIVSSFPVTIEAATNLKSISIKKVLDSGFKINECYYFIEDHFCKDWNEEGYSADCINLKKSFSLKKVKTYSYQESSVTLYLLQERK